MGVVKRSALLRQPTSDAPVIGQMPQRRQSLPSEATGKNDSETSPGPSGARLPIAPPRPPPSAVASWHSNGWDSAGAFLCARDHADLFVWLFRRPRPRQPSQYVYGAEAFCLKRGRQTDMRARCRYDNTHQARRAACKELARLGGLVPITCQ